MPDVKREPLIPLWDNEQFPGKPSSRTLKNWATKGFRLPSGEIVVLESAFVGSRRHSSLEAFYRFQTRLDQANDGQPPAAPAPPPSPGPPSPAERYP